MLKKNLIILFLLSLYSTVLVHRAIPHHHHAETADSHTHHHSPDHHDHHHDDTKHAGKTSKDSNENKAHPLLALHLLIGHSEQIFINQAGIDLTIKVKDVPSHIPVAENISFPVKIPDPYAWSIPPKPDLYSFAFLSASGFRAPPAQA